MWSYFIVFDECICGSDTSLLECFMLFFAWALAPWHLQGRRALLYWILTGPLRWAGLSEDVKCVSLLGQRSGKKGMNCEDCRS